MADRPYHTTDEECTVDPDDRCCIGCGVSHAEVCHECRGRGFHRDECPSIDRA